MKIMTVNISEQNVKDIETQLKEIRKPESAVKTAINNTTKKVQKTLANKASKEYAGPISRQKAILSKSEIIKASAIGQVAFIKFKSPVHEPRDFHVIGITQDLEGKITGNKLTKKGKAKKIKINVLKGSAKEVKGAFVVRFPKSGHVAIAVRKQGSRNIRTLLSPSYMKMIGNEKVYDANEIAEILNAEVEKVISKTLKGANNGK